MKEKLQEDPLGIRLFGGLEVRVGGQPIGRVRSRSVEWLLALLAMRQGREAPRSWLAGLLWPESAAEQALFNLRRNLMDLRRALGPAAGLLRSPTRDSLLLDLTAAEVDLIAFDRGIAAGDDASLALAVSLYRGPLLEGWTEEWVLPERVHRTEACLQALEALAERSVKRAEHGEAEVYLRQAAAIDPLRDSTQRRLMELLAARGDTPAAILTFREYRLSLHQQLGLEPDPETTRLFRELRRRVRPALPRRQRTNEALISRQAAPDGDPPAASSDRSPLLRTTPLPRPLTALIGRDEAVGEVLQALTASRLVTLAGEGGVGKTRLALQVAEQLSDAFDEEVAFVELAPLANPSLVASSVAEALGIREQDEGTPAPDARVRAMIARLNSSPALLVLDNCEHVIEEAAQLAATLLAACPELCVLATSRQRLALTGEVVWRVPPLPAPNPDTVPPDDGSAPAYVLGYPASQLFVERAAAARPGFHLGGREEALTVAEICRRLDGIPLAIELAAARVRVLTPQQIVARLDDRFRLLTRGARGVLPRHQTLRALIDWSYDSLPEAEAALLRRLSVFAGGCTLEAAEAVCGVPEGRRQKAEGSAGPAEGRRQKAEGSPGGDTGELADGSTESLLPSAGPALPSAFCLLPSDALDLLDSLVDRSLLLVDEVAEGLRYRLLETVREYAWEKLAGSGELAAVRNQHRDWFLQLAEQADVAQSPQQPTWLTRLEAERDNMRAALGWCQAAADAHPAPPDSPSGLPSGGTRATSRGARLGVGDGAPCAAAEAGLRLATALGWFWRRKRYLAEGLQWLEGALARGRELPAPLRATALVQAAHMVGAADEPGKGKALLLAARQEYEQALALARASGNRREIADAVLGLAEAAHRIMEVDSALSYAEEARQHMEALEDRLGLLRAMWVSALLTLWRGDRQAARPLMEELVSLVRESGDAERLTHALGAAGHLERDDGNYDRARAVYQESLILRREVGNQFALAQSLEDFAVLAGRERQHDRAVRLLGAAEPVCEALGARTPVSDATDYQRTMAEGRAALGEPQFATAWAEGRALSLEQAIAYALETREL